MKTSIERVVQGQGPVTTESSLDINYLPENVEELEHDLDVLVEFDVTDHSADFVVDPTSIDLSLHDSIGLLRRYLPLESINAIHPAPSLKESPLLQKMRDAVLGNQTVQSWTCGHCGFEWKRRTVRKPRRCVKCARPL